MLKSCPETGQLVVVRKRPFVVTEVIPSSTGIPPEGIGISHLIKLSSVEDDAFSQRSGLYRFFDSIPLIGKPAAIILDHVEKSVAEQGFKPCVPYTAGAPDRESGRCFGASGRFFSSSNTLTDGIIL